MPHSLDNGQAESAGSVRVNLGTSLLVSEQGLQCKLNISRRLNIVYDAPIFPRTEQGAGGYREALGGDDSREQHFIIDNGCDQQKLLGTPVLIWEVPREWSTEGGPLGTP